MNNPRMNNRRPVLVVGCGNRKPSGLEGPLEKIVVTGKALSFWDWDATYPDAVKKLKAAAAARGCDVAVITHHSYPAKIDPFHVYERLHADLYRRKPVEQERPAISEFVVSY